MIIKPESHMRLWFYIFSRESYIPFNENHTIIKGEKTCSLEFPPLPSQSLLSLESTMWSL